MKTGPRIRDEDPEDDHEGNAVLDRGFDNPDFADEDDFIDTDMVDPFDEA